MIERAAFRITPDLRFLYPHRAHEAAFAALVAALRSGEGLSLVDGEVGTGKSILLRRIEAALRTSSLRPRYLPYSELSVAALLAWADGEPAARPSGRPPVPSVLLLDDAENCSNELLDGLREIAAKRRERRHGPQIVLVGGTTLWPRVLRELPRLAELIDPHVTLSPFTVDEIDLYVRHRLQVAGRPEALFSADAIAAIAGYSRGVPRLVNQVCSRALILADLDRAASISQATISEAIDDCPAAALFGAKRPSGGAAQTAADPDRPSAPVAEIARESDPLPAPSQAPENVAPAFPDLAAAPSPEKAAAAVSDRKDPQQDVAAAATAPTETPAPGPGPLAGHRRRDSRLKFKVVDVVDDIPPPPPARETPAGPPVFSGFVPRDKAAALQLRSVEPASPAGRPVAFSGFVPRRKQRDALMVPAGVDRADPSPRVPGRYRAVAFVLLGAAIAGVIVTHHLSPRTTEAAAKAAGEVLGMTHGAVREIHARIEHLLSR